MGKKQRNVNRDGQVRQNQENVMEEQVEDKGVQDQQAPEQSASEDQSVPATDVNVAGQQPELEDPVHVDGQDQAVEETTPQSPVTTTVEQVAAGIPESPIPEISQASSGVTLNDYEDSGASGQVDEKQNQQPAVQLTEAVAKVTGVAAPEVKESLQVAAIRYALEDYIKKMSPGVPIQVKDGAVQQVRLYNTLMTVVNRMADSDFNQAMTLILDMFNEHAEGVFHPRYVFRFMEHIELTSPRISAFQRLLNMFHLMAPVGSRRQAVDQCNWSETLSGEITDAGRNRVLSYFKVG
jgi:hypothetical protein